MIYKFIYQINFIFKLLMGSSCYLCVNEIIKSQVLDKVIEEKNDNPLITNFDKNNKNLIINNNAGIIIKTKKMNEYENIKSEKVIDSIKSVYVLKDIFSFLSEKQELKIIIYNKDLKKKLDINIGNYKRIRGIYREGERNGKGK